MNETCVLTPTLSQCLHPRLSRTVFNIVEQVRIVNSTMLPSFQILETDFRCLTKALDSSWELKVPVRIWEGTELQIYTMCDDKDYERLTTPRHQTHGTQDYCM